MTKEQLLKNPAAMAIVSALMDQGLPTKIDVADVEKTKTNKIIIPETMSKLDAAEELKRQWKEEENVVNAVRDFSGWEYRDVLVAIKRGMEKHFGWIDAKTTYSFFGARRPQFIQVVTDIVDGKTITEEAFYGVTEVAAWENASFNIGIHGASQVRLSFELKKKYKDSANEFFALVEEELKNNSIYRAKSLVITNGQYGPEYNIIENKPSDKIFLNEPNRLVIEDFVMPELLEDGKRTYLFTGDYGTGKTETAMKIGKIANENEMSFIYLKDSELLEQVILLSQNYSPCVLFLEDLDEVASGERGADINHILNTLDGVQSKRSNLKIIFTTNHEDKINSAFRRPGRIDQIVKFEYPDAETKLKIVDAYTSHFEGHAALDRDIVLGALPDAQGAVIAEICKRAARLATRHNNTIDEKHFISSAASIQPQIELMKAEVLKEKPTLEKLVTELVVSALRPVDDAVGACRDC